MAAETVSAGRPRAFETIVYGGLAVGMLDFLDASIFFPLYYGISFQQVWWGPASGIIGRDAAKAGGWNTALFGILMHFVWRLPCRRYCCEPHIFPQPTDRHFGIVFALLRTM